jgi:hypothetical protein
MKWADFSRHCRRSRPCSTEQKAKDNRSFKFTWRRLRQADLFEEAKLECEPPAKLLEPCIKSKKYN